MPWLSIESPWEYEEGVMLKLLSTFCMDFPFLRDRLRK
jgi:hypothetical protein